jgi:sugar lactone lactonase YvrE
MADDRLRPLLDGGRYFEAPRWHDGRLWLVDASARTLISVSPDGKAEIACTVPGVPAGLGFLPGGATIVTDMHNRALTRCSDGVASTYADLSTVTGTIDDMTTDGIGRAYVGDLGFDLKAGIKQGPYGRIVLVEAGREPRMWRTVSISPTVSRSRPTAGSSSSPKPMAAAWPGSMSTATVRSTSMPGSATSARRMACASTRRAPYG